MEKLTTDVCQCTRTANPKPSGSRVKVALGFCLKFGSVAELFAQGQDLILHKERRQVLWRPPGSGGASHGEDT